METTTAATFTVKEVPFAYMIVAPDGTGHGGFGHNGSDSQRAIARKQAEDVAESLTRQAAADARLIAR